MSDESRTKSNKAGPATLLSSLTLAKCLNLLQSEEEYPQLQIPNVVSTSIAIAIVEA